MVIRVHKHLVEQLTYMLVKTTNLLIRMDWMRSQYAVIFIINPGNFHHKLVLQSCKSQNQTSCQICFHAYMYTNIAGAYLATM